MSIAQPAAGGMGGFGVNLLYTKLPFSRTEYYNTADGGEFLGILLEARPVPGTPDELQIVAEQDSDWNRYRAGHTTEQIWNRPVFGPAFGARPDPVAWVTRTGDQIFAVVPLFGDADGRAGYSLVDSARTTLLRDGQKVGETDAAGFGRFDVPAGEATYRLEVTAERGSAFSSSTKIATAWTFRSGHAGDTPVPLPVAALRFTPRLDDQQSAPGGRPFAVPLAVQWHPDATHGRLRQLTVEVSFDDGATWRRAPVVPRHGGGYAVLLTHPRAGGYVSLRASASDSAGNTVEQTIIKAYRVTPRS